eukprot:8750088-Alexandrium_andersonii.AAC.1
MKSSSPHVSRTCAIPSLASAAAKSRPPLSLPPRPGPGAGPTAVACPGPRRLLRPPPTWAAP